MTSAREMLQRGRGEQLSMRSLVHSLVGTVLGPEADRDTRPDVYLRMFYEVFERLSSSTARPVSGEEEAALGDLISDHLLRSKQRDARGLDAHLRFHSLSRRLHDTSSLRRQPEVRCGMLRLLHALRAPTKGDSMRMEDGRRLGGSGIASFRQRLIEPLPLDAASPSRIPQPAESRVGGPPVGWHVVASGSLPMELSEKQLLRDLLHALQGMDSACFRFGRSEGTSSLEVNPSIVLTRPVWFLCRKMLELGDLHLRLCSKTNSALEAESGKSLLHQALCEALREQLRDYYKVLALLMAKVTESRTALRDEGDRVVTSSASQLTLRRLWSWLQEPLERMRLLDSLCEVCLPLRGGALASAVYGFSRNGDAMAREACTAILKSVVAPLFSMIRVWMTEGELRDPFGEFFVCADSSIPLEELWQCTYSLETEMVPCFVNLGLARKILLTGKSVNFIRLCCPGQLWLPEAVSRSSLALPGASQSIPGNMDNSTSGSAMPLADLDECVGQAALLTNQHLVSLMMHQYGLGDHCLALRRFLLLGQGDFVESLMDFAEVELEKDASQIYRHQLIGLVDMAVRQSNAQFCSTDTIARLSVKLLSASGGEKGWDVFLLDYAISSPLHVVFTPVAMKQYDRAFAFLWKLRRASHSLASCWSEHMALQRHLVSAGRSIARRAPELSMELRQTLHKCGCLRNQMHHFVQNIHSYIMCGVLDSSWAKLQAGWQGCLDLDQVILEHQRYLTCIEEGAFLSPGTEPVLNALNLLFGHALSFTELHDQVCASAFEAMDVLATEEATELPMHFTRSLAECRSQLDQIAANFLVRFQSLLKTLEGLPALRQLETDVRFLLCRLDFNNYYKKKTTAPWNDRVRLG